MVKANTIFALAICCLASTARASQSKEKANFEYLLLAQFWPSTSCLYFEDEGKDCLVPPGVDGFTIHGLWPSIPGTEKPDFCNASMKFDYDQIKSLSMRLSTNWPYYCKEGPKTELWEHEWTKHGTCAFSMPTLQGELKYFNRTLGLQSGLNTINVLAASGIVPSETKEYAPMDIFEAVKKGYGAIPDITCFYEKKTKQHHLEQVWLCFNKELKMIDCPDVSLRFRESDTLYFESMEHQGANVGSYFEGCPKSGTVSFKPIPRT